MNDSVIIFGGFDFIGFQLCKVYLEEGFDVISVLSETESKEIMEVKSLEIGRNANFNISGEWANSSLIEEVNLIIFDMYSLHLKKDLGKVSMMYDKWLEQTSHIAGKETDLIVLLPIHDCYHQWARKRFEDHVNNLFLIYLPTIYGEWQPEEFAFQQAILRDSGQKSHISICEREFTGDAIYVSNAINAVREILKKRSKGEWLLQNQNENQWKQCASLLSISKEDIKTIPEIRGHLKHIQIEYVDADEVDCQGLKKQKQHTLVHRQ